MTNYEYNGKKSDIRKKIVEMSLSGSGILDIARVPEISPDTVINDLKKKEGFLEKVSQPRIS